MVSRLFMIWPLPIPQIHVLTLSSLLSLFQPCLPALCPLNKPSFLLPQGLCIAVLDACNAPRLPSHLLLASSFLLVGSQLKCHFFHCLKFPCLFMCLCFVSVSPKECQLPVSVCGGKSVLFIALS